VIYHADYQFFLFKIIGFSHFLTTLELLYYKNATRSSAGSKFRQISYNAYSDYVAKTKGKYVAIVDRTEAIKHAIEIANKTNKIVWQNIAFALGVKIIVMILGAGGVATMWEAIFADVGVALIAVLNAMRVMK
jgi:hypothetical protein